MMAAIAADRVGTAAFILSLREKGVSDLGVLRALEMVPRDAFAPQRFLDLARADVALPLPCGQTMTSPTVVAQMLGLLGVSVGHRVLEIGTGSGWVTALLARLGGDVRTYEKRALLSRSAAHRLAASGVGDGVEIVVADGISPGPENLRFDRILLNGALPRIPLSITSQLATGGRLVGAVTSEGSPRLVLVRRREDGTLVEETGIKVRLAPLTE